MSTVQKESFKDCLDELKPLFQEEWDEWNQYPQFSLDPKYEWYLKAEEAGVYHLVTVRVEGVLVGFITAVLHPDMHSDAFTCTGDTHFIKKEYRNGITSVRLFTQFTKEMKDLGAQRIIISSPYKEDRTRFFEHLGYHPHEITMIKTIGE